jgi:ABC-type sugar transport system ATPase subunit
MVSQLWKFFNKSFIAGLSGSMATICLRDVTKIYSEQVVTPSEGGPKQEPGSDPPVTALNHVNLTIPSGQTMAILGPSGCGKSTLLRIVAGLETDFTGHVFYDGQDMKGVPPKDRSIGMVFQSYALYPHLKGWDNLAFFFKVRDIPDKETEERIKITSEIMGIGFSELLPRKPGTYSGGEKQRVALARAIVRKPRLLLFDEPLSNLDPKLRNQTRVEIKRLLRRFRITTIYVTHDQEEAFTLGDQLTIMRQGWIEQVGLYTSLRRNPVNTFVAGFLGAPPMNLFRGGRVEDNHLYLDDLSIPLPQIAKTWAYAGRKVTVGIQAEAIQLAVETLSPSAGFHLRSTVEVIEPNFMHRTQQVYLRTGRFVYATHAAWDTRLKVGDEIEVILPADQLYFFDSENEHRIG